MATEIRLARLAGAQLIGIALCGALAAHAVPVTIEPGEVLEVPFTVSPPAPSADTLTFRFAPPVVPSNVSTMTVELCVEVCDGAGLLASIAGVPVNDVAAFVESGSLWQRNAVAASLDAIADGSTAGLIRVIPAFGMGAAALTAEVSPITSVDLGVAVGSESLVDSEAVVLGTLRVVPEPAAAVLLLGAGALGSVRPGRARGCSLSRAPRGW